MSKYTDAYLVSQVRRMAHRNKVMKAIIKDPAMGTMMEGHKPPFDTHVWSTADLRS